MALDLATLGLSAEAVILRRDAIGGSDANTIMSGDEKRLLRLWKEKRGESVPEDLSDNLAVQMGSFTEPLNIAWFEKNTGRCVVTPDALVGKGIFKGIEPFMRCTVDGIVAGIDDMPDALFEAKHCGFRSTDAEIFARYVPQLTHNLLCVRMFTAFLSCFKGNGDWVVFEYALDPEYVTRLIEAETAFWACVKSGMPPCPVPAEPTPKPVGVVEYDMAGNNAWAVHCGTYLETKLAADRHADAKDELKELVPADASKCFGGGIIIKRDKRGALRFSTTEGE